MLNPKSPLPLYHQLADILTEHINMGKYKPGDLIPSETSLAKTYRIGRPTVRQAMDLIVRKGMVERKRGSGTFVKPFKKEIDLFSLAGTSQAFKTKEISITKKIIEPISLKKIDEKDHDNPFSGSAAYFFSRLTLAEKRPVLLEDFFLDAALFKGIDNINLKDQSLADIVRDHYFLEPEDGRQTFRIQTLSKVLAGIMKMKKDTPVLEVKRVLNFPDAKEAVFSKLVCSTDEYAFSQTILGRQ